MNRDHNKPGRPLRAEVHSTSTVTIRITAAERAAIEAHCERRGKAKMGALIREAMAAYGLLTMPDKKRGV